jgi:hypothetical protein
MNFPKTFDWFLLYTIPGVPAPVSVPFVTDIPALTGIPAFAGTVPATAAIVPGVLLSAPSISAAPAVVYVSGVPVFSAACQPFAVLMFLLTSSRDSQLLLVCLLVLAILLLLAFLLLLASLLLLAYLLLLTSLLFLAFLLLMTSQATLLLLATVADIHYVASPLLLACLLACAPAVYVATLL